MGDAEKVVNAIAAMIPKKTGNLPWYDKVPADKESLLEWILDGWRAGKFGTHRRTAARVIAAFLTNEHGIPIGEQGVEIWLIRRT